MRETVIVPEECPPSLSEIKRALLLHEKVYLVDPSDRDTIPPTSLTYCMGMPPIFSMDTGSVAPLAKTPKYDNIFDWLISEFTPAIKDGSLAVIRTFAEIDPGSFIIGNIGIKDYPLDPRQVFWTFRSVAGVSDFLSDAVPTDLAKKLCTFETFLDEIPDQISGIGAINDVPSLEGLAFPEFTPDLARKKINILTFGRLGNVIKYLGYCHAKDIIPSFNNSGAQKIVDRLFRNANGFLCHAEEKNDMAYFRIKSQIHDLLFSEFLDESSIETMSVADVLKFRSSSWGKSVDAREHFFSSMKTISEEFKNVGKARELLKTEFEKVLEQSSDLESERRKLNWRLKCDMGAGLLSGGASVASGLAGATASFSAGIASSALILAAGGVWALQQAKVTLQDMEAIRHEERKLHRSAFFNILQSCEKLLKKET